MTNIEQALERFHNTILNIIMVLSISFCVYAVMGYVEMRAEQETQITANE